MVAAREHVAGLQYSADLVPRCGRSRLCVRRGGHHEQKRAGEHCATTLLRICLHDELRSIRLDQERTSSSRSHMGDKWRCARCYAFESGWLTVLNWVPLINVISATALPSLSVAVALTAP